MDSSNKTLSKEYYLMTYLLKILHIIFGLDLGFFAHSLLKVRLVINIYKIIHCATLGVLITYQTSYRELDITTIWSLLYYFEYLVTVLLLSCFKRGTTFMNLQVSLKEIDIKLKEDFSRKHIDLIFSFAILFIYFGRFLIIGFYCIASVGACFNSMLDFYIFVFLTPSCDISLLCYLFVYYSVNLRLSKLSLILEANDDFNYIQHLYKDIVDTVEKYKPGFDNVYMLLLIFNITQVMGTIYHTLREWQNQDELVEFVFLGIEYFYLLELFALTIAPALAAEMMTTQAEEIKKILHDKRLLSNVQHKEGLQRFIQYVEARPCRFRVWKLVPLSADLLSMVLSFCVTYLIVIVQFTQIH